MVETAAVKILAVDPGKTTGYCFGRLENGIVKYFPSQSVHDVDDFWRLLHTFQPRIIVMEDFEYRHGRQVPGLVLFSVQLIGVARLFELTSPQPVGLYLQSAATGKSHFSDNILKQRGLYFRGVPHALDASRHLMHWFEFKAGYQLVDTKDAYAKLANSLEEIVA